MGYKGDLVFANSTCFDEGLMEKMARRAEALKEGAIVVTTTESIPSLAFEVLEKVNYFGFDFCIEFRV